MATPMRQARERDLVVATRALFDERGMQDAPIEEIAKAVGIARGLIYRHFSSKEELFVLTVTDYLAELSGLLDAAVAGAEGAEAQLRAATGAFAGFCARYPAFLDCSVSLMHRPARELHEIVSESVWLRLGQGMARCVNTLIVVLRSPELDVEDPDFMANVLWTQVLGIMHLARSGVGIRQVAPGVPELFGVSADRAAAMCVEVALRAVRAS
jgi:AcrR family transcriptional regulator